LTEFRDCHLYAAVKAWPARENLLCRFFDFCTLSMSIMR
jgi:hypothetical protein